MALVLADRVKETSATTGTGTLTLAGAASGFQSFAAIGNGNQTYYAIVMGANWEVGIGTYTAAGTLLSRDTVLASSNAGAAVNFAAGTKDVFVTLPSNRLASQSGIIENNDSIDNDYTIATGNNAMSAGPVTIATGKTVTVPTGSVWTVI